MCRRGPEGELPLALDDDIDVRLIVELRHEGKWWPPITVRHVGKICLASIMTALAW